MAVQRKWMKYAVRAVFVVFAIAIAVHGAEYVYGFYVLSKMFYERGLLTATTPNERGDEVRVVTDTVPVPYDTTIALHRRGHWFSTTLLDGQSNDFSVGVKWRGNDTLEVQVDFGPNGKMGTPVRQIGPIHILYHFGGPDAVPAPDIEPNLSCPGPYHGDGGFWKSCDSRLKGASIPMAPATPAPGG